MDDDGEDDDEKTLIFDRAAHGLPPLEKSRGDALFPLEEIEAWEHTMMMDDAPVRELREAHRQKQQQPSERQPLGVPRPAKQDRDPPSVRSQNRQAFDAIAQHIAQPTPPPPSNRKKSERPPAQPPAALSQTRAAFPPPPHSSNHPPPLAPPVNVSPTPPPVIAMSATPPPVAVSQPPPAASPFARSASTGQSVRPGSIAPAARAAITTSRSRPPPIAGLILFAAPMGVAMLLILALAFS